MRTDVVVLGAGIVGVSVAVHLQKRGRAVLLVDRAAGVGADHRHVAEVGGVNRALGHVSCQSFPLLDLTGVAPGAWSCRKEVM